MPPVCHYNTRERCFVSDHDARMPVVRLRVPVPLLQVIDESASENGMTRSALVRELIVDTLIRRNRWPRHAQRPD